MTYESCKYQNSPIVNIEMYVVFIRLINYCTSRVPIIIFF